MEFVVEELGPKPVHNLIRIREACLVIGIDVVLKLDQYSPVPSLSWRHSKLILALNLPRCAVGRFDSVVF